EDVQRFARDLAQEPGAVVEALGYQRRVQSLMAFRVPGLDRLGPRLNRSEPALAQVADRVGDELDLALDHRWGVHERALRPEDHEHVGELVDGDAEVGGSSAGPLLTQRAAAAAAQVDPREGAGDRVEAE